MRQVIIAGHYCVNPELSELNSDSDVEFLSWKKGLELHANSKEKSTIVLWVNDIGVNQQDREVLKNNYKIPDNYRLAMNKYGISITDINIEFESTIRNKASVYIKKLNKSCPGYLKKVIANDKSLTRCVSNYFCSIDDARTIYSYVINGPNNESLVVKDGPNPKCNLILATLYDKYAMQDEVVIHNIFNGIYESRIEFGIYVYKSIYSGTASFNNIFVNFGADVTDSKTNKSYEAKV